MGFPGYCFLLDVFFVVYRLFSRAAGIEKLFPSDLSHVFLKHRHLIPYYSIRQPLPASPSQLMFIRILGLFLPRAFCENFASPAALCAAALAWLFLGKSTGFLLLAPAYLSSEPCSCANFSEIQRPSSPSGALLFCFALTVETQSVLFGAISLCF